MGFTLVLAAYILISGAVSGLREFPALAISSETTVALGRLGFQAG